MRIITSRESLRHFEHYMDEALEAPLSITSTAGARLVLLSAQ